MANSNETPGRRKQKNGAKRKTPRPPMPEKPYKDFPLFAHQTGRWAKKVRGKIRFYGRWGKVSKGVIKPVDDVEASAAEAKKEFDRCWPYHAVGEEAPAIGEPDHLTMRELANRFLEAKENRMKTGELSPQMFEDYRRICKFLDAHFGANRRVDRLTPSDFEELRKAMSAKSNLRTLDNKINRARIVFKFAFESRLIEQRVHFGQSFDRPSKDKLRKTRNEKMFTHDELMTILGAFTKTTKRISTASTTLHAMVLLGLNAGFGNMDVATLPMSAIDLKSGWVTFPRPKTGVHRRAPLWPETIAALRAAIADRPEPANQEDADICFLTRNGTRFIRVQRSKKDPERFVVINGVLRQFEKLLSTLKVGQRNGVGFYTLRHVFETVAGGSKDQVAVDSIMGHADQTMAAHYRESIDDARLLAVAHHVRAWLWPKTTKRAVKSVVHK